MRKPTIKELRTRDEIRLAERKNPEPTPEEIKAARHTMTLFYRFAAAYERSFYIDNDRRSTEAEKAAAEDRSNRAYIKASEALKNYNLKISLPGLDPIIEETNGANFTYGHFYKYA